MDVVLKDYLTKQYDEVRKNRDRRADPGQVHITRWLQAQLSLLKTPDERTKDSVRQFLANARVGEPWVGQFAFKKKRG